MLLSRSLTYQLIYIYELVERKMQTHSYRLRDSVYATYGHPSIIDS